MMGTISPLRSEQNVEEKALSGLCALIERAVDERVRPLEEMLKAKPEAERPVEEYLDVEELSRRIHTEPKTIRDWVHKNKIPFEKLPTGGVRFPWGRVEAWIKGDDS